MPTRTKTAKSTNRARRPASTSSHEVLTLAETAAFLRVSEDAVLQAADPGGLPGRLIDGQWRFLKSAVQDWLCGVAPRGGREAVLKLAGAFKDDPFLEEIVQKAYERRGRQRAGTAG